MDQALRVAERNNDSEQLVISLQRSGLSLKDYVENKLTQLAELLQAKFRLEKELWQQVPYWCWAADGRTGWNAELQDIYVNGLYLIYKPVYIDCATGEVVTRGGFIQSSETLDVGELNNLPNVQDVLENLQLRAKLPRANYISPPSMYYLDREPAKYWTRSLLPQS